MITYFQISNERPTELADDGLVVSRATGLTVNFCKRNFVKSC